MEDNQGAIAIARNPTAHARAKHIDISYHFVSEAMQKGTINLYYCPTKEMIADLLMKLIPRGQLEMLRLAIGIEHCTYQAIE